MGYQVLKLIDDLLKRMGAMDLQAAELHQAKGWNGAKVGAFICFIVASALLIAALVAGSTPTRFGAAGGEARLHRIL